MTPEVLDAALEGVFGSDVFMQSPKVEFLWHCGEPLLAGVDFYRRAFERAAVLNRDRVKIQHSIQTNGTLINAEWCDLFREYKVNIGLSIDGPEDLHDAGRPNWAGRGSFDKSMAGFHCLKAHGVHAGALCVITDRHLDQAARLIEFFVEAGFPSVGFNVEEIDNDNTQSSLLDASNTINPVTRDRFRRFLEALYEAWLPHREHFEIREFKDFIMVLGEKLADADYVRRPDEVSEFGITTIHKSGDVSAYSPEFAGAKSDVYADFVIGNVIRDSFDAMYESQAFCRIRQAINTHTLNCQRSCYLFDLCGASYVSNVYFETGGFDQPESSACQFLRHDVADLILERLGSPSHSTARGRMLSPIM